MYFEFYVRHRVETIWCILPGLLLIYIYIEPVEVAVDESKLLLIKDESARLRKRTGAWMARNKDNILIYFYEWLSHFYSSQRNLLPVLTSHKLHISSHWKTRPVYYFLVTRFNTIISAFRLPMNIQVSVLID